ncbi:YcbK family protein [Azospirillum sp. sgz302134]
MSLKRRNVLAGCGVLLLMPAVALAQPMTARRLSLRNQHTGETFNGPYRDADGPLADAMADLAQVLRDHHANKVGPVDVGTLDLLADIMEAVGQSKATILSAFRTPETNAKLAAQRLGVAEHSQHLLGKALDVTFPSRLPDAHRKALELKRGGVGWYPRSFFLHIDTGPVRSWELFGRNLDHLFAPGVNGRLRTVADRMRLHRALARRRLSSTH